ncbi:CaiB/BaiF CoA transferase family protein [Streptomyces sioyaensis]
MSASPLPLAGVRVIDLSRALSGPFCTTLLADLGADVVKVETPGGDMIRTWGPYDHGVSLFHVATNRNKRSVALDTRSEEGRAVLRRMVQDADVLVENFRTGVLEKIGVGPDWLAEHAPGVLLASIRGFGSVGPLKSAPCFDQVVQGMGGLMSLTGEPGGGGEMRVGIPIADLTSGMFAALGVAAGLAGRARGSRPHRVETSLLESVLGILNLQAQGYLSTGVIPRSVGNDHPAISPYGMFRTADRPVNIAAGTQRQFEQLCTMLGLDELPSDERFLDAAGRLAHRQELRAELERELTREPAAAWVAKLRAYGVPAGPVHDMAGVMADEQVQAVEMVSTVEHPDLGTTPVLRGPLRVDGTPTAVSRPAPRLGEHSREIMRETGISERDIDRLIAGGVLLTAEPAANATEATTSTEATNAAESSKAADASNAIEATHASSAREATP